MAAFGYGYSFVAKLSSKIIFFFFLKNICFLKNMLFADKNVFMEKKSFFIEKNINENVKKIYLISEIYFYTENVCVTNKI